MKSNAVELMVAELFLAALGMAAGFQKPAGALDDTCPIIALVPGGEPGAEALSRAAVNATLPLVIQRDGFKLSVYDVRFLDITCSTSTVTFRVPIKVQYSPGPFVSLSERGSARIQGHYTIVPGTRIEVCVDHVTLARLNLTNVPNSVDEGVRSLINRGNVVDSLCFPVS